MRSVNRIDLSEKTRLAHISAGATSGSRRARCHLAPLNPTLVRANKESVESRQIAPGVVLDFDAEGQLVGIDIDCASQVINLSRPEAVSRSSALSRYAGHPIRLIGLIG